MLDLLLAVFLAAGAQYVEPWGLSLSVKDDAIVVDAVRSGSLAEKNRVPVGAVLLRLSAPTPTRPGALGTLDGAALDDVRAELSQTKAERVTLELVAGGETRRATLDRSASAPKSGEELRAMSPMEQARYFARIGQAMHPPAAGPQAAVNFADARADREAFVDPKTHKLLGVVGAGATGAWVQASVELHYLCSSPATAVTLSAPGLAPLRVDLSSQSLHGGQQRLLLPVAKLADVEACPREPLARRFELELRCSDGAKVAGREKVRLFVKCEPPKEFLMPPFSRQEPKVDAPTVAEGTADVLVRPFLERAGPVPLSVDVLVVDARGAKLTSLPGAWRGEGAASTDAWEPVRVPVPPTPGAYQVVFEAHWADGSTSRSATTALTVLTRADAEQRDRDFQEGSRNMLAVDARMKAMHIDPCNGAVAMAWLKLQPEVASVTASPSGDYSWLPKKGVSPVSVHCHGGY